jgi:hypothetical protein
VDGVPTVGDGDDPLRRLHGAYISATGRGGALLPPRKGAASATGDRARMPAPATPLAAVSSHRLRPAAPVRAAIQAINAGGGAAGAIAAHRYALPVVREIAAPPADRPGDRTW